MFSQEITSSDLTEITPKNVTKLDLMTFLGRGSVRDLEYSSDGNWLGVGSSLGVWLYRLEHDDSPLLLGKDECGDKVIFAKNSRLLASSNTANTILFWEIEQSAVKDYGRLELEKDTTIRSIAFHPNGKFLAVGTWQQSVQIWNIEQKTKISELLRPDAVNSLAYSPDAKFLAIGGWEGKSALWQIDGEKVIELPMIYQHRNSIQVGFSANGQFAYGSDGVVILWDVNSQTELKRYTCSAQLLEDLAFSPDETMLAVAHWAGGQSGPGAVRIFELTKNIDHSVGNAGGVSLSFYPDSKKLAFAKGGWDSTIEIYDIQAEKTYFSPFHGSVACGLAISSDSKLMAYGARQGIIRVIDVDTGAEKYHLQWLPYTSSSAQRGPIAFHPTERQSIIFLNEKNEFFVWNLNSNNVSPLVVDERFLAKYLGPFVTISGNSSVFVIGTEYLLYRIGHDMAQKLMENTERALTFDAAITTNGEVIVAVRESRSLAELSAEPTDAFPLVANLQVNSIRGWMPKCISITPDERLIIAAGSVGSGTRGTAIGWLWDVKEGRPRFTFQSIQYYGAEMQHALFSPDYSLAIFSDTSGTIFIWDIEEAQQISQFRAHPSSIWDMAFTSDGKRLITVGADSTIRVWGIRV